MNFDMKDMSMRMTPSRAATCSARQYGNQFCRPHERRSTVGDVPAGAYHAITLHGEVREGAAQTLAFTYWFAPGVGMVKQVLKKGGRATVYELERFEAPG